VKTSIYLAFCGSATLLICAAPSQAYELTTHAALTQQAFLQSDLNNTDQRLIQDLGVNVYTLDPNTQSNPFGATYFDVQGTTINLRTVSDFEWGKMPQLTSTQPNPDYLKINGWLMRGAIREDDNNTKYAQDDPDVPNVFHREFNHFFDPVNNQPLTVFGAGTYYFLHGANTTTLRKAPDWAMGTDDVFTNANQRGGDTLNHFTIFDAREAEYRALTLKAKNPDGSYTDIEPSGSLTTKEAVRKAYWATTFRALGDILHLNQDMAQPQTRDGPSLLASHGTRIFA
jgi:hypothetical protein